MVATRRDRQDLEGQGSGNEEGAFTTVLGRRQQSMMNAVRWIVFLLIAVFMIVVAVTKIMHENGKDAMAKGNEFFQYLTNISWTLYSIFYAMSEILFPLNRSAYRALMVVAFFPLLGQTVMVFVLVKFVFRESPVLLAESVEEYGIANVVLGDEIFHLFTVLIAVLYWSLFGDELILAFREMWRECCHWYGRLLLALYESFFPLFLLGLYDAFMDPHEIYHTDMKDSSGWIIAFLVYFFMLCVVVSPFLLIFVREDGGVDDSLPLQADVSRRRE